MDPFGQTSSLSEMVLALTRQTRSLTLVLFIMPGRVSFVRVLWVYHTYLRVVTNSSLDEVPPKD